MPRLSITPYHQGHSRQSKFSSVPEPIWMHATLRTTAHRSTGPSTRAASRNSMRSRRTCARLKRIGLRPGGSEDPLYMLRDLRGLRRLRDLRVYDLVKMNRCCQGRSSYTRDCLKPSCSTSCLTCAFVIL